AVACFFPPTDFLSWGKDGNVWLGEGPWAKPYRPAFEFWEREKDTNALVLVTDADKRKAIGKQISPLHQATKDAAPALIVHGDADKLVPIQQGEVMAAKLKEHKVPCELVVKKGADHGWKGIDQDVTAFADWYDKHLLGK
ncbi:MAG: prolyl oligopeptidase family serine peptidase, partial [Gemmataceae bacterium]|nr:prolyl oligopeptidase family serine peptidase [Gemmataceae bacterium]